jgi:hypothetical protein
MQSSVVSLQGRYFLEDLSLDNFKNDTKKTNTFGGCGLVSSGWGLRPGAVEKFLCQLSDY